MHMRSALLGGLFIIIALLFPASAALAGTEWHIGGETGGANNFRTLEEFRQALDGGHISMGDGDVILLHKDDNSLTAPLNIPDEWRITIASADGLNTVIALNDLTGLVMAYQPKPNLTLRNVRLAGDADEDTYGLYFVATDTGKLTISNTQIQDFKYGTWIQGDMTIDVVNSTFSNNSEVNALYINNFYGDTTTVNVAMTDSAPDTITWKGASDNSLAITMNLMGDANLNFDIAAGKILNIRDSIMVAQLLGETINVTKKGDGVLKVTGGAVHVNTSDVVEGAMNFVAEAGTVHFRGQYTNGDRAYWWDPYGSLTFKEGSVFKPDKQKGNMEDENWDSESWISGSGYITVDTFHSEEGSRLEIGLISEYPTIPNERDAGVHDGLVHLTTPAVNVDADGNIVSYNSTIASTMKIDNPLLKAELIYGVYDEGFGTSDNPEDWNAILVQIDRVENLSTLQGVGEYADVYRRLTTLSDPERDMLDAIYARGGLSGSDRAFLQTLSGAVVTNSLLGMRHNWANLMRKINRRITDFQHEELMELEISGSEFCRNSSETPIVDYLKMWAGIDKSWMRQTDRDSLAGYRYDPYGFHIGLERHCENLIIGGVVRYDDGAMELKSNSATKTDITNVIGSAYVSWASEGFYITGSVHAGYGWNEAYSNYRMPGLTNTAETGNFATTLYGAQLEVGYMYENEIGDLPFRATTYGGLAFAKMHRQAVTESGGGNLDRHFRRGDWTMWEPSFGVRFAMPIERGFYTIVPTVDVAVSRTLGDADNDSGGDAYLIADPSSGWRISTVGTNRTALRLSGGLNAHFARNIDIGCNYDFEWRGGFTSHQINLNFSMGF